MVWRAAGPRPASRRLTRPSLAGESEIPPRPGSSARRLPAHRLSASQPLCYRSGCSGRPPLSGSGIARPISRASPFRVPPVRFLLPVRFENSEFRFEQVTMQGTVAEGKPPEPTVNSARLAAEVHCSCRRIPFCLPRARSAPTPKADPTAEFSPVCRVTLPPRRLPRLQHRAAGGRMAARTHRNSQLQTDRTAEFSGSRHHLPDQPCRRLNGTCCHARPSAGAFERIRR